MTKSLCVLALLVISHIEAPDVSEALVSVTSVSGVAETSLICSVL